MIFIGKDKISFKYIFSYGGQVFIETHLEIVEYDEIKICKDFRDPNKCETMPEYVCEANLLYVTLTRARKKITFLDERILDVIF